MLKATSVREEDLHYPCSAVGAARKPMNGCSALQILLICIMHLIQGASMRVSVSPRAFGNQQQASDWP